MEFYILCTHIWIWCKNILLILPDCVTMDVQFQDMWWFRSFNWKISFSPKIGKANLFLSSLFSRYVVLKWQQQVFVIIEFEWYWCNTGNWYFLFLYNNLSNKQLNQTVFYISIILGSFKFKTYILIILISNVAMAWQQPYPYLCCIPFSSKG